MKKIKHISNSFKHKFSYPNRVVKNTILFSYNSRFSYSSMPIQKNTQLHQLPKTCFQQFIHFFPVLQFRKRKFFLITKSQVMRTCADSSADNAVSKNEVSCFFLVLCSRSAEQVFGRLPICRWVQSTICIILKRPFFNF